MPSVVDILSTGKDITAIILKIGSSLHNTVLHTENSCHYMSIESFCITTCENLDTGCTEKYAACKQANFFPISFHGLSHFYKDFDLNRISYE